MRQRWSPSPLPNGSHSPTRCAGRRIPRSLSHTVAMTASVLTHSAIPSRSTTGWTRLRRSPSFGDVVLHRRVDVRIGAHRPRSPSHHSSRAQPVPGPRHRTRSPPGGPTRQVRRGCRASAHSKVPGAPERSRSTAKPSALPAERRWAHQLLASRVQQVGRGHAEVHPLPSSRGVVLSAHAWNAMMSGPGSRHLLRCRRRSLADSPPSAESSRRRMLHHQVPPAPEFVLGRRRRCPSKGGALITLHCLRAQETVQTATHRHARDHARPGHRVFVQ